MLEEEAPQVTREVPGVHPVEVELAEVVRIKFLLRMGSVVKNMAPVSPVFSDVVSYSAGPMPVLVEIAIEAGEPISVAAIDLPEWSMVRRRLIPIPS